jgi:large subunit ribosomal protein L35
VWAVDRACLAADEQPDLKGSKMPKMKTKSGAKKRFSLTASGKVKFKPANKRHGMSKRPTDMRQQSRRMEVMADQDTKKVRRFFLPYGL